MPVPHLSAAQVDWVVQQVVVYIGHQRQTHRPAAAPLSMNQKNVMRGFFPEAALDSTRLVVLAGQPVNNPPFYGQLIQMGFSPAELPDFAHMTAITFLDTVVSHEPLAERLLFPELVHVVQYWTFGVPEFAAKYVSGFMSGGSYEAIPLEMNAYELDERFAAAPARPFSVVDEVQAWMSAGKL